MPKVVISTRIQSSKTIAAGDLINSSTTSNLTDARPIPITPTANQEASRSASKDPTSAGAGSTRTGAVAAILTPATPVRGTAGPKVTPSALQNRLERNQHGALMASHNALTAADTQRIPVQTDVGDDYMRLGQYDKAINFYESAFALSPGNERLQQRIERALGAKAAEEQILRR
jgi:tetratricopeptide (TPR) repeat protein